MHRKVEGGSGLRAPVDDATGGGDIRQPIDYEDCDRVYVGDPVDQARANRLGLLLAEVHEEDAASIGRAARELADLLRGWGVKAADL